MYFYGFLASIVLNIVLVFVAVRLYTAMKYEYAEGWLAGMQEEDVEVDRINESNEVFFIKTEEEPFRGYNG